MEKPEATNLAPWSAGWGMHQVVLAVNVRVEAR